MERSTATAPNTVYADFDELVRLQYRVAGFSFLPRQPVNSVLAGRNGSRLRGRGLEFDELRHYRPGDDIRNLDWKVTQRTGKPHVRSFRQEREREVLLLVDQRIAMFFGSELRMKSVVAAELAAISAWRVLAGGDRVGALLFNDSEIVELKPRRSRRAVHHLLGELTRHNHGLRAGQSAQQNSAQLNLALREAERLARHDCLIILVSDFEGWDENTMIRLKRLARHNDVLAALVFDPLESQLPAAGQLVVSDGQLQIQVDSGQPRLKAAFAQHFSNALERLQAELGRHAVPVIPVDTLGPVEAQLRRAIGQRLAGGRGMGAGGR